MSSKKRLQDLPSGGEGTGYLYLNGSIVKAFMLKKITPTVEGIVKNQKFLGERVESNAVRGIKITGDITYYNTSTKLKKAIRDYKNGTAEYPDLTVQYYAENAAYGREEITLSGVILAKVPLGGLDDSSDDATTQESSFTAEDFDINDSFTEVDNT